MRHSRGSLHPLLAEEALWAEMLPTSVFEDDPVRRKPYVRFPVARLRQSRVPDEATTSMPLPNPIIQQFLMTTPDRF